MSSIDPSSPSPRRHILVVEDDEAIGAVLCETMVEEGYDTSRAPCLADARAVLSTKHVDAILLDLMLGAESGERLLEELSTRPDAPGVVLMSASPLARAVADRFAIDLLPKPFELDQLMDVVARLGGPST